MNSIQYTKQCNTVEEILSTNDDVGIYWECGTGKTSIINMHMMKTISNRGFGIFLIVIPSLPLMDQMINSCMEQLQNSLYININSDTSVKFVKRNDDTTIFHLIEIIKFCSEGIKNKFYIKLIVDEKIRNHKSLLIISTYDSLNDIINYFDEMYYKFTIIYFDEAHNIDTEKYKRIMFDENHPCLRNQQKIYFTATPTNKFVMMDIDINGYNKNKLIKKAFKYHHNDAVKDKVLKDIHIHVDFFIKDLSERKNYYSCIARKIIETGNKKVLLFHNGVNNKRDELGVKDFVNKTEFCEIFMKVQSEINKTSFTFNNIMFQYIDADTEPSLRKYILYHFNTFKGIFLLSSCKTIAEGINTTAANMCVFINPRSSQSEIEQNIGRTVRMDKLELNYRSIILLPICLQNNTSKEFNPQIFNSRLLEKYQTSLEVIAKMKKQDPLEINVNYLGKKLVILCYKNMIKSNTRDKDSPIILDQLNKDQQTNFQMVFPRSDESLSIQAIKKRRIMPASFITTLNVITEN